MLSGLTAITNNTGLKPPHNKRSFVDGYFGHVSVINISRIPTDSSSKQDQIHLLSEKARVMSRKTEYVTT